MSEPAPIPVPTDEDIEEIMDCVNNISSENATNLVDKITENHITPEGIRVNWGLTQPTKESWLKILGRINRLEQFKEVDRRPLNDSIVVLGSYLRPYFANQQDLKAFKFTNPKKHDSNLMKFFLILEKTPIVVGETVKSVNNIINFMKSEDSRKWRLVAAGIGIGGLATLGIYLAYKTATNNARLARKRTGKLTTTMRMRRRSLKNKNKSGN